MTFNRYKTSLRGSQRCVALVLVPVLLVAMLPRTVCLGEGRCSDLELRGTEGPCGGHLAQCCCARGDDSAPCQIKSGKCKRSAEWPAPMAASKARVVAKFAPVLGLQQVGQLWPTSCGRTVEHRLGGTRPPLDAVIVFARLLI